jgi:2,4-dienoyl-CoA reductase-like NADH-dependent reductase (Old Yellow Enzyme family)
VITTAHSIAAPYALDGSADSYIEYCRRRAAGGVGMIIAMPVVVDPLPGWPSQVADRMAALAEAVHAEGGIVVSQVVFFGAQIGSQVNHAGRPMWSLNGRQDEFGEASHRMTADEVQLIVDAHEHTARVIAESGLDGLELHGGHGYLFDQALSPWGNDRDDEWGEPMALPRALITATRRALGPDKILGFRITANDALRPEEGGLSVEDHMNIAVQIVDTGEIDYLNPTIGIKAPAYSQISVANYWYPDGFDLPYSEALSKKLGGRTAIVGIGGIVDPRMGEEALRDGICDLVAMTRANIADPDLVNKLRSGAGDRVRPCVRAGVCNDYRVDGKQVTCFHNPEMLRERQFSSAPAAQPKRVLVIGAGPAGLKAAQSALVRGHSVRILEAADVSGGRLRWIRSTAAKRLFDTVGWLERELATGGVRIEFGTRVSDADVAGLDADEFVVATGARAMPARAFDSDDAAVYLSLEQALDAPPSDEPVLVLDRTGQLEVALTAHALAQSGRQVTYVTPFERIATNAGYTSRLDLRDQFRRATNIRFLTDCDVRAHRDGTAILIDPDGEETERLPVSRVVVGTHPIPQDGLIAVLRAAGKSVRGVGDVLAPRGVTVAIREGAVFGQAISA